jgi:MYXO-CTERM domain-containing protein
VRVTLDAPLSDPEVEVRARVSDLAGNETVVRRTVAWLLRAPPPPPPRPDGGPSVDGGMRSAGGDEPSEMSGGCGCRTTSASDGAFVLVGLAAWLRRRRAVRGSSPDRSSR